MRLVSFSASDGRVRPGALFEEGGFVTDLATAGFADALAVVEAGMTAFKPGGVHPAYPLSKVRLHAPLLTPPRVFAIGLNYRDHARELGLDLPQVPVVFFKLQTAIVGPGEPIVLPINSKEPD